MSDRTEKINKMFASQEAAQCESALDEIGALSELTLDEKVDLASGLATLFYRDHAGDTQLSQLIKKAEKAMVSFGPGVVDWVIGQFDEADAESAEHFARVVGRIGADAVGVTAQALKNNRDNSYLLINLLLSVGHFTDPAVLSALPQVFDLAMSNDYRVKSAALYCVGRISKRIPAKSVDEKDRGMMFDKCFAGFADPKALVRRHAVRAIGKMIKNSYLNGQQIDKSRKAYKAILGMDDYDWDDAYIVRNEAAHYLPFIK